MNMMIYLFVARTHGVCVNTPNFDACVRTHPLAEVPHQLICLARSIHDTRYYGGHFAVGFSSFASGCRRSTSGRGLLGVSGRGTPPPKMSGKVNS